MPGRNPRNAAKCMRVAVVCGFAVIPLLLGAAWREAEAATSTTKVQIVVENPAYSTIAVGHAGTSYGINVSATAPGGKYRLFTSHDEGRSWASAYDFPANTRIYGL